MSFAFAPVLTLPRPLVRNRSLGLGELPLASLRRRYANDASRFMPIQGVNVHYRVEGEGEPLLLVHGIMASLHTWDGWTETLKRHYQVIRLDLPPFGLTGPLPDGSLRGERLCRFLIDFLDALGLERVHYAGNSLGGYLGWQLAVHHPERVGKLILLNAAGYRAHQIPSSLTLMQSPLGKAYEWWLPRAFLATSIREVVGHPRALSAAMIDRYHDLQRRPGVRPAMRRGVGEIVSNMVDRLPPISARTLIIWGRHDRWIPLAHAFQFQRDIPGSALIVYDDLGHIPMEEAPRRTVRDALAFLQSD